MIIDKIGDILHTEADVICHQVNCKGVMGAGLAKQIRNQLLSEEQYRTYQEICREYGRANLGKVIRMKTDTGKRRTAMDLFQFTGCLPGNMFLLLICSAH